MLKSANFVAPLLSICLLFPTASTPAAASTVAPDSTSAAAAYPEMRVGQIQLDQAKAKDLTGYRQRYKVLSGNPALMELLTASLGAAAADRQVQELAATTTSDMVKQFTKNTRGKTFVATSMNDEWGLALVNESAASSEVSPMRAPIVLPQCWQAWVAAYAWYVGIGAICGAVSLATFMVAMVGGAVCFVGVFTSGMVINWNNAC